MHIILELVVVILSQILSAIVCVENNAGEMFAIPQCTADLLTNKNVPG